MCGAPSIGSTTPPDAGIRTDDQEVTLAIERNAEPASRAPHPDLLAV